MTKKKDDGPYLNIDTRKKKELFWRMAVVKAKLECKSYAEALEKLLDIAEPVIFKRGEKK